MGAEIAPATTTAEGGMIDLRFQVIDPSKAKPLEERLKQAAIIEATSGGAVQPAYSSKVGSLRAVRLDQPGHIGFILFRNPNRLIQSGSSVIVIAKDIALGRLTV